MIDKIYHTSHAKLIEVTIAAYRLLSKLCKLPRSEKFEMSHPDFDELGCALMEIANSPAPPPPTYHEELPPQIRLAANIFAQAWQKLSRSEEDLFSTTIQLGDFEVRVAVAVHAIPEDVRRRMVAPFN